MHKFTPCLWFDSNAEEAVRFYISIFKNSRITGMAHYGQAGAEASGRPEGTVMTVSFELDGQPFLALNGGPEFKFSPAISFIIDCHSQQEIDDLWQKLSEGGQVMDCGWITDKFGVSWQVVPATLNEMMLDKDADKTERVMKAMLGMKKLDMGVLEKAYRKG